MNDQSNEPIVPVRPEPVYQNWIRALTKPNEQTYAAMAASPNAKATTGYLWYFVGALVMAILSALVQGTVMRNYFSQYTGQLDTGSPLYTILCGAPILAVISTLFFAIGTALVQWIAKMFGGRGTNDQLAFVFSNILTPYMFVVGILSLLSAIPFVGFCFGLLSLAAAIYVIVLEVMAVKGVNQISWGGAIGAVFIPVAVVLLFCICLVVLLSTALAPVMRDLFQQLQQNPQSF